jgi:hypothetical protein
MNSGRTLLNAGKRHNACKVLLTAGLLLSFGSQLPAIGAHGKSHHHTARQEEPQESASENSEEQSTQGQSSEESSAPSEEAPSTRDGTHAAQPASQAGVSLFNVLGQVLGVGLLIVLFGALPMSAMVLFCSIIWHSQKAFNGGKKPSIG